MACTRSLQSFCYNSVVIKSFFFIAVIDLLFSSHCAALLVTLYRININIVAIIFLFQVVFMHYAEGNIIDTHVCMYIFCFYLYSIFGYVITLFSHGLFRCIYTLSELSFEIGQN